MTPRNRNIIIIAVVAIMVILGFILFFAFKDRDKQPESGGSGIPDPGTLLLRNVEATTSDGDEIPLSSFLSTDQQNKMRGELQAVLVLRKPLPEYNGAVVNGTVTANYETNDISFDVRINELNDTYRVIVNSVSSVVTIIDSSGKKAN